MIGILYSEPAASPLQTLFDGPAGLCPVAGRYRMIDFTLSNLANAGVGTVGIAVMPKEQPELSAYLGVGQEWDLDRRRGGITWLPGEKGKLKPIISFLAAQTDPYVLAANGVRAWTIPCQELLYAHLESGCDITAVQAEQDSCPGLMVLSRGLLLALLDRFAEDPDISLRDRLETAVQTAGLGINLVSFSESSLSVHAIETYYHSHLSLSEPGVLAKLFSNQYPIFTRQQDDAPAYLDPQAKVENTLVSGGCTVCGTVRHSVLFQNTHIGAGAAADHCVLLPGCVVEPGAVLRYVLSGQECRFSGSTHLEGSFHNPIILAKGSQI